MSSILEFKAEYLRPNRTLQNIASPTNFGSLNKTLFNGDYFVFQGAESYLEIPHYAVLNGISNQIQIEFIANIDSTKKFLIAKTGSYEVYIENKTMNVLYTHSGGDGTFSVSLFDDAFDKWQYFLITVDLTLAQAYLYLNNKAILFNVFTGISGSAILNSANNIFVGEKSSLLMSGEANAKFDYINIWSNIFTLTERNNRFTAIKSYITRKNNANLNYNSYSLTGLLALYKFDTNFNDSSINLDHGTGFNNASTVFNYLATGNNDLDYVQLPNFLNTMTDFSVSFWAKVSTFTGHASNTIMSGSNALETYAFSIEIVSSQLRVIINNSNYTSNVSTALNSVAWQHIAVVRNGTTLLLYINGVLFQTITSVTALALSIDTDSLILGQKQNSVLGGYVSTESLAGGIENLFFYNRVISIDEVLDTKNFPRS